MTQKKLKFEIWWNVVHRLLRNLAAKLAIVPYNLKVKCLISDDEISWFLFFELVKCMSMNTFRIKTIQIWAKFGRISSNFFKFLKNPDFYHQISGVWQNLLIWNLTQALKLIFSTRKKNKFLQTSWNFAPKLRKIEISKKNIFLAVEKANFNTRAKFQISSFCKTPEIWR